MPETFASMPKLLQIVCWLLILTSSPLLAQRTCGTQKLDSILRVKNPKLESKDAFERWMENQRLRKSSGARTQSTYTIPVVVHVIHNGSASQNIPDAQIISQISVLNKDFQRLNTDAAQTPTEFQSVAGSLSVEFVLAKQDPDGNPTTGIVRVNGGKSEWQQYQDSELKGKSYWPAERYLNVWVANIPEYLGYSTFPISTIPTLEGLDESSGDRLTDGVVVHYQAFGSIEDGAFNLEPQFNRGRTLTHEIGHFLGLRHIWGDVSSCSGDGDYVNDTPFQSSNTSGCPSNPQTSCGHNKMFQNYMDYTNDACMNLFTAGQFGRVETVLQNSPRRASLLISPGAQSPGNFVLDLGIAAVASPTELECSGSHTPTITIRNYGTNTVTQASVRLSINGNPVQTITPSLSLNALQQTQVSFNAYNSNPSEIRNFEIAILSVNGVTDEYSGNNTFTITTKTAAESSLPFTETFNGSLNAWNILNSDNLLTWELSGSQGSVLYINNYDYENEGAFDKIFSPVLDASTANGLLLKFKLAHSHYTGADGDALAVYATTGCTEDLSNALLVYYKEGSDLGTTSNNQRNFVPTSDSWNTEYISLNDFIGAPNLRLAFVSRNGYGNNIYIDSIQVSGDAITDLALAEVIGPSWAVCTSQVTPQVKVLNQGSVTVNGFMIQIQRSGITIANQNFPYELAAGQSLEVSMSDIALTSGKTDLVFTVTPNSIPDDLTTNNSIEWPITFIGNSALIPTREDFIDPSWTFVNAGSTDWGLEGTNYQQSAVFRAFDAQNPTDKAWLVSPQLDFSKAFEARMFAEFSYAQNGDQDEHVLVMLSDNCGQSFDHVLRDFSGSDLGFNQLSTEWTPSSENDWKKESFELNDYVGRTNILVAIQLTNDNGNNFYVDNIEFFENDDPTPPEVKTPFQVYSDETLSQTFLTFNLEEQQPAAVVVSNIMGASIANLTVDNALNQTLTFQLDAAPAIYIFRVLIGNEWHVVKQYIGN